MADTIVTVSNNGVDAAPFTISVIDSAPIAYSQQPQIVSKDEISVTVDLIVERQ